jgi:hypothetical protein
MDRVAAVLLLPLLNVLVFALTQTAFFWHIGSNEVLTVVGEKANVVSSARKIFQRTGHNGCTKILDSLMWNAKDSVAGWDRGSAVRARNAKNWSLIKTWMGPWVVSIGVLAIGCAIVLMHSGSHRFGRTQWMVGLPLIIVSYVGEIMFFLFVVQRYIIVGDFEMIRLLLGVSPPGTGYDDTEH